MSDSPVKTCDLCGRLVMKGQGQCACGARVYWSPENAEGKAPFDYSKLLPFIPAAGFLMFLYITLRPSLVMFTGMPILKTVLITFIASAALAVVVADRARKDEWPLADTPFTTLSPTSWFAAVLVIWPLAFPAFIKVHFERTHSQRMKLSYLAFAAFMLSWIWVAFFVRNSLPQSNLKKPQRAAVITPTPEISVQTDPPATTAGVLPAPSSPAAPGSAAVQQAAPNVPERGLPVVRPNDTLPSAPNSGVPTPNSSQPKSPRRSPSSNEPQYGIDILGRK